MWYEGDVVEKIKVNKHYFYVYYLPYCYKEFDIVVSRNKKDRLLFNSQTFKSDTFYIHFYWFDNLFARPFYYLEMLSYKKDYIKAIKKYKLIVLLK